MHAYQTLFCIMPWPICAISSMSCLLRVYSPIDKLVHLLNYFRVLNLELDTFEFSGVTLLHDIGPLSNIVAVNKHNEAYVAYLLGSPRTKRVIYVIARHPGKSIFPAMLPLMRPLVALLLLLGALIVTTWPCNQQQAISQ